MSLQEARMPRLSDKLLEQAEEAEALRVKLEKEDTEDAKVIKKTAKKK